mmetsp:Transcript_16803/g.25257  ORF Transcript_16803/g.25257 Transcript_16803/m.25257 type:complete len:830 (-) Transcript_16803:207-2696(-)
MFPQCVVRGAWIIQLVSLVMGTIREENGIGRKPLFHVDMSASSEDTECIRFIASGSVTDITCQLYFEPKNEVLAQASDMFMTLSTEDENGKTLGCVHRGGFRNVMEGCLYAGPWDSQGWNESVEGFHFDKFSIGLLSGEHEWKLCVGNGWFGSVSQVRYQSQIDFFESDLIVTGASATASPTATVAPSLTPPTRSPTLHPTKLSTVSPTVSAPPSSVPLAVTSSCDDVLILSFDALLGANEQICLTVSASGHMDRAVIDMTFLRSYPGVAGPYDMTVSVQQVSSGRGIWLGGDMYKEDSSSGYEFLSWPDSWQSIRSYSENYADMNLMDFNISGSGLYRACLMNSFPQAGVVHYTGDLTLGSLVRDCEIILPVPSISPSSVPSISFAPSSARIQVSDLSSLGEISHIYFELNLRGGESGCIEVSAGGYLQNISLDLQFAGNGVSWASDLLVSINDASSDYCVQVGGTASDLSFLTCDWLTYWPSELNSGEDGVYSAQVALHEARVSGFSVREICFTNAYSSASEALFRGEITLEGFVQALPPTPVPTAASISKRVVINPYAGDDAVLMGLILIPIVSILFIVLLVRTYMRRRKQGIYTKTVPPEEDTVCEDIHVTLSEPVQSLDWFADVADELEQASNGDTEPVASLSCERVLGSDSVGGAEDAMRSYFPESTFPVLYQTKTSSSSAKDEVKQTRTLGDMVEWGHRPTKYRGKESEITTSGVGISSWFGPIQAVWNSIRTSKSRFPSTTPVSGNTSVERSEELSFKSKSNSEWLTSDQDLCAPGILSIPCTEIDDQLPKSDDSGLNWFVDDDIFKTEGGSDDDFDDDTF